MTTNIPKNAPTVVGQTVPDCGKAAVVEVGAAVEQLQSLLLGQDGLRQNPL